jgi:hypothetical protein
MGLNDQARENAIGVLVDGEHHPDTVPTRKLLELGEAFFAVLERVAEEAPMQITGLRVVDGCVQLEATTDEPKLAARHLASLADYLEDVAGAPHSLHGALRTLLRKRREFGTDPTVAFVGAKRFDIPSELDPREVYVDTTVLYATVIDVGGERFPRARLKSLSEPKEFSARIASREDAQQLARLLYQELEVEIETTRLEESGRILRAQLLSWSELSDEDPAVALRRYIAGRT